MFVSLLVGLAIGVGAPADKDAPKKEASLVGTWIGEKGVRGGKERPIPEGGITFNFTADGKFLVKEGNRDEREMGTYKIDSKKSPAEIDLTPTKGKDGMILGIFKVDGDTLTMCVGGEGGERPAKFDSPDGSQTMLMTMTRKKEK